MLAALAAAAIPVITLKGSALVETVYPDATWRDMGDIDLLVRARPPRGGVAVVRALGYAPLPGSAADRRARVTTRSSSAPTASSRSRSIVTSSTTSTRASISTRSGRGRGRARPARHLLAAPHDLLIHVCVHFLAGRAVRSEGALGQIRDMAWIAARGDVDWAQLLDVSRRFGVADRVRLALAVTDGLGLLPDVGRSAAADAREAARAQSASRPAAC